ncbi:MAG: Phosphate transport system regulatory protein PhoU, partial [uncultured Nocardioidaceae bacterium]
SARHHLRARPRRGCAARARRRGDGPAASPVVPRAARGHVAARGRAGDRHRAGRPLLRADRRPRGHPGPPGRLQRHRRGQPGASV